MPRSHSLSAATLRHIADRVSERFGRHAAVALSTGAKAELTETFEVWFLERLAIAKPNTALAELAHRTGYWHHQINIGGLPTEYAHSKPFGPGDEDWSVDAISHSELPAKVDAGITLIDADPSCEDTFVRLLLAPAYLTSSLWLTFPDKHELVLPVMAPGIFQSIQIGKFISANQFLIALGQEQHSRGLPRLSPTSPPPP
jgi:hypothetical protein